MITSVQNHKPPRARIKHHLVLALAVLGVSHPGSPLYYPDPIGEGPGNT